VGPANRVVRLGAHDLLRMGKQFFERRVGQGNYLHRKGPHPKVRA